MLVVLGSLERLWALLSIGTLVAIGVIAERAVPAFAAACGSGVAYSGSGTAVDPYLISEADHLIYLSQTTSDWSGKYFSQTADVDLEDCSFSPIGLHDGGSGPYFTGTYNGGGNTISGLTVSHTTSGEYAGLFGATNGDFTVTNLGLEGVNVSTSGNEAVGSLLGYANLGSGAVTIRNVYVSGVVTAETGARAGGIVGDLREWSSGTINVIDSYSAAVVNGPSGAGGLAANTTMGTVNFTNTYATGLVTREGGAGPQGILGNDASSGSVDLTVTDAFWDTESTGASTGWPRSPDIGTGKTTSEMKLLATFANWDIVNGWEAYDFENPTNEWGICSGVNDGYPFLLWQYDSDPCPSSGGGNTGRSDDDDDDEETGAETPAAATSTPPVVRQRVVPPRPTPLAAATGPVLPTGSVPAPPAGPRVLVGGQPTAIEQSITDARSLNLRASTLSLGLSVADGNGSVTSAADGSARVAVKQGSAAEFQGTGMQPGAIVQVFIPLRVDDAREIAQFTVNEDGTFSGDASFSADPLADPLPIGTRLLQLVTADEDGNQVVLDISVDIEQADPSPAINRDEGVVPEVEPGGAVVMSAGKPTDATITGVEDQKLAVVEGDGWDMSIILTAGDAAVEPTDAGARLTLIRDESARVAGTGFLPGTRADVWLFSEPTLLGTVTIDDNGEFSGDVVIDPALIPTGEHTLQLQGVGQDGYVKAASMGVVVDDAAAQTVTETTESTVIIAWWIVATVIVLVLLLIVLVVARRRRMV